MLVLTRKIGDVIAIGDNIKVVVMAIKGKQVKLGIEADKSTIVHREEIYQKIKLENELALKSNASQASEASEILKKTSSSDKKENNIIIKKKS